jgi:multidrug resistance efflux pump
MFLIKTRLFANRFRISRKPGTRVRASLKLLIACALGAAFLAWAISATLGGSRQGTELLTDELGLPETVEIDRGDITLSAVESGSVESGDDDVVRCRVESFLGLPAVAIAQQKSAMPQQGKVAKLALSIASRKVAGNKSAGASGSGGQASQGGSGSPAAAGNTSGQASAGSKSSTAASAMSPRVPVRRSAEGQAAEELATAQRQPTIKSFQYTVEPHTPLRLSMDAPVLAVGPPPPPTTILTILPEGTHVEAGAVVCELDSSAFRDELKIQKIRCLQAKAWVEQSRSLLEASQIALREYEGGIFPQDLAVLRHHERTCEIARERCQRNLAWSQSVATKGYRTAAQLKADTLALQDAEIGLEGAHDMLNRLVNFTYKRILKSRMAKVEAIRADMLSLETSYQIEQQRLRRIETMIANCTLRAPRTGVIVHANKTNGWGHVEAQIQQGQHVYESQPIFRMLDPRSMRIRARINQSQVALIKPGLKARILLDAYPDRPLTGTVHEITPIPQSPNGPFSDVLNYYANVSIDTGGFDALRPGLSAEVVLDVETHRKVPRIPIESIRWMAGQTFAALAGDDDTEPAWEWKPVTLGISDTTFAEVISGLEPGDKVVTEPDDLPAPILEHMRASRPENSTLLARELR